MNRRGHETVSETASLKGVRKKRQREENKEQTKQKEKYKQRQEGEKTRIETALLYAYS